MLSRSFARRRALLSIAALLGLAAGEPAGDAGARDGGSESRPVPEVKPRVLEGPTREPDLVARHRQGLALNASSTWPGWPTSNAVDGDEETSWFSNSDDSAAKGRKPWLEVKFSEDVTVRRIEVLGNRDPAWALGYTIHLARVELFDAQGKSLWGQDNEGWNRLQDVQFNLKKPVQKVRRVRFTSLSDEGDRNPYGDIAIAEVRIW